MKKLLLIATAIATLGLTGLASTTSAFAWGHSYYGGDGSQYGYSSGYGNGDGC